MAVPWARGAPAGVGPGAAACRRSAEWRSPGPRPVARPVLSRVLVPGRARPVPGRGCARGARRGGLVEDFACGGHDLGRARADGTRLDAGGQGAGPEPRCVRPARGGRCSWTAQGHPAHARSRRRPPRPARPDRRPSPRTHRFDASILGDKPAGSRSMHSSVVVGQSCTAVLAVGDPLDLQRESDIALSRIDPESQLFRMVRGNSEREVRAVGFGIFGH